MRRKFIDFPILHLLWFSSDGCRVLKTSSFLSPVLRKPDKHFSLNLTKLDRLGLTVSRHPKSKAMNNEKVKFLLNWNHFGEHLSSCMTKLMTDSSYSDIIIATADKHMIYSHRFVLGNSSKYFQRLFRQVTRQRGIQLVVALPEIKYDIFKILMNYMYKGETQVPHELLPSVIKAGQFLEINGLVNLNENDSSGNGENSYKHLHPKCSPNDSKHFKRMPSTLRDNTHSRDNTHNASINVLQTDKVKNVARQNVGEDLPSRSPSTEENGKENCSKLPKSLKCKTLNREKKIIQLPMKRKSYMRDSVKKTSPVPSSSSSLSCDSCPPKKLHKKHPVRQGLIGVEVKAEKETNRSPVNENATPGQEPEEKITIKMEVPDDIEEVVYNELQCEYCHEVYTNPSGWVKHMTDQHGDRGYQSHKDVDKSVGGSAVITCVVCSCVCFSAAEWAKHLRLWHTERELTVANMTESRKSGNKIKKRPENIQVNKRIKNPRECLCRSKGPNLVNMLETLS